MQAMIDANGDGRVEYQELLDAAKACMADEAEAARTGGRGVRSVGVQEVLTKVAQYMKNNRVGGHWAGAAKGCLLCLCYLCEEGEWWWRW